MAKNDAFDGAHATLADPASDGLAVAPSDTEDLALSTRAIYVGSDGDVAVEMVGGTELVFAAVNAGTVLPVRATKIRATGTTATSIIALW